MTNVPTLFTYASAIMHKSVGIALMLVDLNLLDMMAADIKNAYITIPCKEKIWTTLGYEFGKSKARKQ